jgi:hypothetical protein
MSEKNYYLKYQVQRQSLAQSFTAPDVLEECDEAYQAAQKYIEEQHITITPEISVDGLTMSLTYRFCSEEQRSELHRLYNEFVDQNEGARESHEDYGIKITYDLFETNA